MKTNIKMNLEKVREWRRIFCKGDFTRTLALPSFFINSESQPALNFINVKRTIFLYERRFSSYILALSKNLYKKFVRKTLMKLTPGSQKKLLKGN